jgi:hypothetical protein
MPALSFSRVNQFMSLTRARRGTIEEIEQEDKSSQDVDSLLATSQFTHTTQPNSCWAKQQRLRAFFVKRILWLWGNWFHLFIQVSQRIYKMPAQIFRIF